MISQSCNYSNGVTILITAEITYLNFVDLYNSKDTMIEKNELEKAYGPMLDTLNYTGIYLGNSGNNGYSYDMNGGFDICWPGGFGGCLRTTIKVNAK